MSENIAEKVEVENWLPHGDQLRILLGSDHISYGEIAALLRSKGVFSNNTEKSQTIPILAASILRPMEFLELLETSISRESRPKEQPQDVVLTKPDANWQDAIKDLSDSLPNLVKLDDLINVEFISNPTLSFDGQHKAKISYEINRKDYSKDLLGRDLKFKAVIYIKQEKSALKLEIISQHSSKETDKINDQLIREITQNLKSKGITDSGDVRKILFSSFTNKNRILFMLRLAGKFESITEPGTIVDVNIRRNEESDDSSDQHGIKFLEGAVRNLKIDGDKLNDIAIFSDQENYEYFFITKMVVDYKFTIAQNSGTCTIIYQFVSYKNAAAISKSSFSYSIDKLLVKNSNSKTNEMVRKQIYEEIRRKVDKEFTELGMKAI